MDFRNSKSIFSSPIFLLSILFVLSILFIQSASAEIVVNTYSINTPSVVKDFLVNPGDSLVNICACDEFVDTIQIKNIGTDIASFQITSNTERVIVGKDIVTLGSGKVATIPLGIATVCGEQDSFEMSITITSDYGLVKQVQKNYAIGKCSNVVAEITPSVDSISVGESVEYTIEITNTGTYTEVYAIDFNEFSSFFEDRSYELIIQPGKTESVEAIFTPDLDLSGNVTVPITIHALRNNLKGQFGHMLIIEPDYAYTISGPAGIEECAGVENTISYDLFNEGIDNNFSLTLTGPDYLRLEESNLFVEAGDRGSVNVIVAPEETIKDEGVFTLTVTSEYGDITQVLNGSVNINQCYDIAVVAETDDPLTVCPGEYTVPVVFDHLGWFEEDYSVTLDAPDFVTLTDDEFTLEPGENETIYLTIEAPDSDEDYQITVTGTLDNGKQFSDTFVLDLHSAMTCYGVQPTVETFTRVVGTTELVLNLQNKGTNYAEYDISLTNAPDWIWINTDKTPTSFGLGASERTTLSLGMDTTDVAFDGYALALEVDVVDQDYTYTIPLTVTIRDKSFIEVGAEKAFAYFYNGDSLCRDFQFYLIILVLLALIALCIIKKKTPNYKYKLKNRIKIQYRPLIILILLFIIIGVIIYVTYGFPTTPAHAAVPDSTAKDIFVWAEDSQYTVNITQYFSDPDMDNLSYAVAGNKLIIASVEGGIVTFTPLADWSGTEEITFIATDMYGDSTESTPFTLEVVDVPEYTFWDWVFLYCKHINMLLILALFIIIFAMFIVKNPKPKGKLEYPDFDAKEGEKDAKETNTTSSKSAPKKAKKSSKKAKKR